MSNSQIFILCLILVAYVIFFRMFMSKWERNKDLKNESKIHIETKEEHGIYCENCENSSLYGCRILNKYTGRYTDYNRDKNIKGCCAMYQQKEG